MEDGLLFCVPAIIIKGGKCRIFGHFSDCVVYLSVKFYEREHKPAVAVDSGDHVLAASIQASSHDVSTPLCNSIENSSSSVRLHRCRVRVVDIHDASANVDQPSTWACCLPTIRHDV